MLRLQLFRNRDFSWATIAAFVFSIGFNAMFLSNMLFLTRIWNYSIIRAGFATSLGPTIVALTAPRFGRLAGRIGQRAVLIPGGLVYSCSAIVMLTRATSTPTYFAWMLIVATGIIVSLASAKLTRRGQ